MRFKKLEECKEIFLKDPGYALTDEGLTKLICSDCEFYKEGEDEELACGAYNMLFELLRKKVLSPKDIIDALT